MRRHHAKACRPDRDDDHDVGISTGWRSRTNSAPVKAHTSSSKANSPNGPGGSLTLTQLSTRNSRPWGRITWPITTSPLITTAAMAVPPCTGEASARSGPQV